MASSMAMTVTLSRKLPFMITLVFREAEIEALDYERYPHPSPIVQQKMEALYLKAHGPALSQSGLCSGQSHGPRKIAEQETYKQEKLEPRLQEAKAGKRKVYFLDAAHFVYMAYFGLVWCFERVFMPSPCGRKRFNVLLMFLPSYSPI